MPFGLAKSTASYQRAPDIALTKFQWKICLVYIDDVIIYSDSFKEPITNVDKVMTTFTEAGVTSKMEKAISSKIKWYISDISSVQVNVKCTKLTALRYDKRKPPRRKPNSVPSWGYATFTNGSRTSPAPPAQKINSYANELKFEHDDNQLNSFSKLIAKVCSPLILDLQKLDLPYLVDTDVSVYVIGCILFRTHKEGKKKPMIYCSRKLNATVRIYSAPGRQCLAVVWALHTFHPYLL